ncbi:MAG: type II toxin-antitoxin system death-on-curing family toxin [Anaerolineae bacterium]
MRFISPEEVYTINQEILGHEPFVRDRHLLRSAVTRPYIRMFGQEAYPTVFEKAGALLHALAHDHVFADGNKRTATIATVRFLEDYNLQVTWTEEEAYAFVLEIAKGKLEIPEIAAWLEAHTTPIA